MEQPSKVFFFWKHLYFVSTTIISTSDKLLPLLHVSLNFPIDLGLRLHFLSFFTFGKPMSYYSHS